MKVDGWFQVSLGFFVVKKNPQNSPKLFLECVLFVKVVTYFDLRVLSMALSIMV